MQPYTRDEKFEDAVEHHKAGRLPLAADLYHQVLKENPRHAFSHFLLGRIAFQQGQFERARQWIEQAIELDDTNPGFHNDLGLVLQALNCQDQAVAAYDRALALRPDHIEAAYNRGKALQTLQQLDGALAGFDRVIELDPHLAIAHNSRGVILQALDRLDDARASFERAIALQPRLAEAHNNLALLFHSFRRLDEGLESCTRAIELKPDFAEAYNNRGFLLQELGRPEEALVDHERAIALKPDYALAHTYRGNALNALGNLQAALESYERAIALSPGDPQPYYSRGTVFYQLKRLDEALASYDAAIQLEPGCAQARWNKSLLKLLLGDYEEGWPLYEARWQSAQKNYARDFAQPLWLGDRPISGKTVLIHAEQGIGDFIQFCRYVPVVEALGAKVIVEAPRSLTNLLRTLEGSARVIEHGEALPAFDFHCPVMSLPLAFKTTLATIPAKIPYLKAAPARQHTWRERLGEHARLRVGLSWSGARSHTNDRNRSIPLRLLKPLLELPIEFHALQIEVRSEDAEAWATFPRLVSHQTELNDFSDTAALIEEMDLVISVDTSVAHLAGALGRPVWILLPFRPDFRWMLDRIDSPWYPTAVLFRQSAPDGWAGVISDIANRLMSRR